MRIEAIDLTWETMALLRELDRKCFPWDSPPAFSGTWWWLAYDGDDPVGYAGLEHLYHDRGFLSRVGVLPSARGHGLQRRLVRARERGARARDLKRMVTYTSKENVVSSNNLIRCGYRLYRPEYEWGKPGSLYWYRDL